MLKKRLDRMVAVGKRHKKLAPWVVAILRLLLGAATALDWFTRLPVKLRGVAGRRIMAAVMAVCMLFTLLPMNAFAVEDIITGLCEHHTEHTADCGYEEAVKGQECGHEHTPDCYMDELICGQQGEAEQSASGNNTEHIHSEACYALDCLHENGEHDEACGYVEAAQGTACSYHCSFCASTDSAGPEQSVEAEEAAGKIDALPSVEAEEVAGRIDALPSVEELTDNAPGDSDPAFAEWLEGIQAIIEETEAAKAAYDVLSVDDQAAVGEQRSEKLLNLFGFLQNLPMKMPLQQKNRRADYAAQITGEDGGTKNYATLAEAFAGADSTDPLNPTVIRLCRDLTFGTDEDITAGIIVPAGKCVKLTSQNGICNSISRGKANDNKDYFFKVYDGSTLILENIVLDGKQLDTDGGNYFAAVAGAELILENGAVLTGNTAPAIRVGTGKYTNVLSAVTMNGGEISKNSAGGILLQPNFGTYSGKTLRFTMNNGEIKNNSAEDGGGITATNSSLAGCTAEVIIHDGKIIGNESTYGADGQGDTVTGGGAIRCDSVFIMDGGEISGNRAGQMGGGIYLGSGVTKAEITGGTIANNTAGGMSDTKKGKGENIYANKTENLVLSPKTDMDGIFLYNGAFLGIPAAPEHTVTLEGAYKRNTQMLGLTVACGSGGYNLGQEDLARFSYEGYGFVLSDNKIKLADKPWSVTYQLTSMKAEGQPATVEKDKTLSTKITADDGYNLPAEENINITMGGVTVPKYASGNNGYMLNSTDRGRSYAIMISKVTGNVVITATGVAQGSDATLSELSYEYKSAAGAWEKVEMELQAGKYEYQVQLPWDIDSEDIYINKTCTDSNADVTSDAVITLGSDGTGRAEVTVTAENGLVTNCYIIEFTKASQPATVTGVTVTPASATVQKGQSMQFSASVQGENGPAQTVEWSVWNNLNPATYISNTGLLSVAADEGAAELTVSAVSTIDNSKSGSVKVTVTSPSDAGGGSSDGGGSGGSSESGIDTSTSDAQQPTDKQAGIDAPIIVEIDGTSAVDENKAAVVNVLESAVNDAILKAKEEAEKNAAKQNDIILRFRVSTGQADAETIMVNLPKAVQIKLIGEKVSAFTVVVDRPDISITLDLNAVREINAQADADVQIIAARLTDLSGLSAEARNNIGSRPAYDLKAVIKGGAGNVSDFGVGRVNVRLPYELQAGELVGGLYAVYVDGSGKVSYLSGSAYDREEKALRFTTNHFSVFGIGYKDQASIPDTQDHWAKEDIEFVVGRGLMDPADGLNFAPDAGVTRAVLVTALGRMAGVDYAHYRNWAVEKGILSAEEATTSGLEQSMMRQEMAVLLERYMQAMGNTAPNTRQAEVFADNEKIAGWAADAVRSMQTAGVMMGKDGGRFDPAAVATRAEAAAALHRYIELRIDPSTAQGLDKNDSGTIVCYENGRLFTGKKNINGMDYYFGADGMLTRLEAIAPDTRKYIVYIVRKKDTLWDLARKYSCSVAEIAALNGISNPDLILVGQEIKIPQK